MFDEVCDCLLSTNLSVLGQVNAKTSTFAAASLPRSFALSMRLSMRMSVSTVTKRKEHHGVAKQATEAIASRA